MATTRNQELQTSVNQAHVSIKHLTSQMDSTNSCIENLEANLTIQLTSLQSVSNQLLNRSVLPHQHNSMLLIPLSLRIFTPTPFIVNLVFPT
jgi:hypothetical protein